MTRNHLRSAALLIFSALFFCSFALTQDIASFEKRVTTKKLPNGLTLVVMERPEAPVFSFVTYVDVGDAQDPMGESGLAHMFEHMAFKGTDKIGTTNFPAERELLQKLEVAYHAYDVENRKLTGRDEKKLEQLDKAWKAIADEAQKYVKVNEFGEIVERNGGVGLNASTSMDETQYNYSMPSNRVELWAYLESERFMHPVFREFYKERDVVVEERRMRVDSSPIGRLIEQTAAAAYVAHPYQRSGVGWPGDVTRLSATEAANFYKHYYTPSNMVIAVVGDVKAAQVMPLMERYFGRLPKGEKPMDMATPEPPQKSERSVLLREQGQPWYIEAYHRPSFSDPDDAVYDAISDLMANGRTSRLYRSLVRDKKIALFAGGQSGFPGTKYPELYLFYAVPTQGKTPQELATAIHEEIERLKTTDVTDDELKMVKTRAKADLIRGLADNEGLAGQLAFFQARYGDWRELFRNEERIEKVTKADIRRVANQTFAESNRTVSMIETAKPPTPADAAPQKKGEQ